MYSRSALISAISLSFFIGLVTVAIIFDRAQPKTLTRTVSFYRGLILAKPPFNLIVPVSVLLVGFALLTRLFKAFSLKTMISLLFFVCSVMGDYYVSLKQEKIAISLSNDDPSLPNVLNSVATWHTVMIALLLSSLAMQIIPDEEETQQAAPIASLQTSASVASNEHKSGAVERTKKE
eukprot:TRINITY_DN5311_c0_g1_i1.p1 TRINITY_DN5311_c0_g1~~TRINITY_DN5311_c0_g1_i1.p1  ORF type:complete len:178 (-),score=38.88 TRINITY_DN5311_c0_g1_i1:248-781(-)